MSGIHAGGGVRVRPLDLAAVAASMLVAAALAYHAYGDGADGGAPVAVIESMRGRWIYPLTNDLQLAVAGPLGDDLIRIEGGEVYAVDCPCPNRICHLQGKISRPGQWIACLPNRVFIRIEGRDPSGIDGIAY